MIAQMKMDRQTYFGAFLAFMLIIVIPIWSYFQRDAQAADRAAHPGETVGWITGYSGRALPERYYYAFAWHQDTFRGFVPGKVALNGCGYGYQGCIGRRFAVHFSTVDPTNNFMDLEDPR